MKDQLTFQLRKIGLRHVISVLTLLMLGLFPMKSSAQLPAVDIGIFPSTTITNGAEVVFAPNYNTTLTLTNIQFTIVWDASLGITITPGSPIFPYNLTQQGPVYTSGGKNYMVFATAGGFGLNWVAGNEYVGLTFTYSSCTGFEIAADAWTLANNGDYYVEVLGSDVTGVIFASPMVCIDPKPNTAINPTPADGDTLAAGPVNFGWEYIQNPLFLAPTGFRVDVQGQTYDFPYVAGQSVYANMLQLSFNPLTNVVWSVTPYNSAGDAQGVVNWSFQMPPAPLTLDAQGAATICAGQSTGLLADPSGGANPMTYAWSPAGSLDDATIMNPTASPTLTTTYSVTVTDSWGQTVTGSVTVTVNPLPTANAGSDVAICAGDCIDLTATGGTVYAWSNGGSTATINVCPTATITYVVTVTDVNGCIATDDVVVTVNPIPGVLVAALPSFCENDPVYTLIEGSPAGGTYSGPGVNSLTGTLNPALAGVSGSHAVLYEYIDGNGCKGGATQDFAVNAIPAVGLTEMHFCIDDGVVTLTNGTPAGGVYSGTGIVSGSQFDPLAATVGTHTITYTYTDPATNCINTATASFIVHALPLADAGADVTICEYECVTLLATGGTTYLWSTGETVAEISVCPTTTTLYLVTVTDIYGCSDVASVSVFVNALPLVSQAAFPALCEDVADYVLTGGSPAGGTYSGLHVTSGIFYPAVAGPGTYFVTYSYTDGNGCTNSVIEPITVNPVPVITLFTPMAVCFDAAPFTLPTAVPSTGTYSGPGVANGIFSPADAGVGIHPIVYNVTNTFGCSAQATTSITVNALPVASAGQNEEICVGACVTLTATGGSSYWWPDFSSSDAFVTICPEATATYTVQVYNAEGCMATASVTVTVNPLPLADAGPNQTICAGECANLLASGGVSYAWSSGDNTAAAVVCPTSLETYTVTVTDANGCVAQDQVTVDVSYLSVSAGSDQTICLGGDATLTATGGVTYLWSTGGTTASITVAPLVTTQYFVTVTDAAGCQGYADVTVFVNALPVANAGADQAVCFGDCATLLASGGDYYAWSNGGSTASITVCPAQTETYTVIVTDVNGCQATDDVTVIVNALPVANAGADQSVCFGACAILTATGGVSYEWNTGEFVASISVCPGVTTPYYVTVTDANGCQSVDNVLVTVNPLPVANAGADQAICVGDCATLTATGGVAYEWSTGEFTASITVCPTVDMTYYVTVTDANGCAAVDAVEVTTNPSAIISQQPANLGVNLGAQAVFSVVETGASSYQWQVSQDGGVTWANLSNNLVYAGTNTANLVIGVTTINLNGYMYKVILGSPCGPSVVSTAALLTIIPPAIGTIAPDITSCASQIVYPIVLVKGIGIGAISLTLNFDASVLVYDGFQNLHPALLNGFYTVVNPTANQIYFSWHSVTPLNIVYDTLVELLFHSPNGGTTNMTWDLATPGNCEFSDVGANVLPVTYYVGSVTAIPSPAITSQPLDVDIEEGQNATFSITATTATAYQWQFSDDNGTSWFNLIGSSMYQGVNSPSLTIYGATIYMDEYLFRVVVGGTCAPDVISDAAHLNVRPIITTSIGNIVRCANSVIVPIYASHVYGVAGISLTLGFNPVVLNFIGVYSSHPALSVGVTNVNSTLGRVFMSWYATSAIDFGDDLLFELEFSSAGGTSSLVWDMSAPENNEYNDINGGIISTIFENGMITVNPSPLAYPVTGGGEYCAGGQGVVVGLNGSQNGHVYELFRNSVYTGVSVAGTGSAISFGAQTAAGTYTVLARNINTLCEKIMTGNVVVTINALPLVNAGPDAAILLGTSTLIDATVSGGTPGYNYSWLPGGMTTQDVTVSPTASTTYTLVVTDSKGCIAGDDVSITVYENIINGYVRYQNSASTPLSGVTLSLYDNAKAPVATAVTNASGYYAFAPVPNGNYTLEASSTKPWGGVNSTDALIIMQHFIQLITLHGLPLEAADVDASGYVNTTDAFNAARRYAQIISSFPAGDWVFETANVVLNQNNYVAVDLDGLCVGDVNGSFIPGLKASTTLQLNNDQTVYTSGNKDFILPVSVDRSLEVGAISLVLHVPAGILVTDVTTLSGKDLVYHQQGQVLRISWYNDRPMFLAPSEALLHIRISVDASFNGMAEFVLGQESELADGYAQVLENVSLSIPKLSTHRAGQQLTATNYPNPFSSSTRITYTLPENGNVSIRVFNMLGEEVAMLINGNQEAGTHTLEFKVGNLVPGIYQYKIETQNTSITRSMIIVN